ncbi:MAG: hypothetical protein QUS66_10130, partial [Bacteroidota bacterium]|nr:hypothetical protein [Bacteroidota bacterium]
RNSSVASDVYKRQAPVHLLRKPATISPVRQQKKGDQFFGSEAEKAGHNIFAEAADKPVTVFPVRLQH